MDVNLLFGSGFKQAGSPLMEMKLIFSLIETGALPASFLGITNLSFLFYSPPRCKSKVSRNVLPERMRFGPFVLRILPPGKIQVNLLLHSAYSHFGFAEDTPARQCSNKLTLPSLIRTLTAPKILRLGKNASELAFFSRLFVLWLRLRYSRSAMFK